MVIQRLTRKLLGVDFPRTIATAEPYPDSVFIGPKVVLLDENSGSDGDIFPWMFRTAGLGLLIGERSWGGVVGINDHGQLDRWGNVNVPEFAYATAEGKWAIEGHGVDPDIAVENDPKSVMEGHDPQLERGVAELLKALEKSNPKLPEHGAVSGEAEVIGGRDLSRAGLEPRTSRMDARRTRATAPVPCDTSSLLG
jgi:tricorn protease